MNKAAAELRQYGSICSAVVTRAEGTVSTLTHTYTRAHCLIIKIVCLVGTVVSSNVCCMFIQPVWDLSHAANL